MKFVIPAFEKGALIPSQYAYAKIDPIHHTAPSDNKNPLITWSDCPESTQSLVLLCVDDKVPAVFEAANQESKVIPSDFPRIDFYHWVVVDIDPQLGEIKEGEDADGIIEEGKPPGKRSYGLVGINSYSTVENQQAGYDGPCPPWNDVLVHEYHFRLYALDLPTLGLKGSFTGDDVITAMKGHVITTADWYGTYTLNPSLV